MLKGNREALEQLCRMLQPAANDQLSIVPQVSPLRQGDDRGYE
jgi:hypothetical protein